LFELNNATTRRNATIVAQRYLAGLASLQAIYDYAVLCNESNNTGDVIAEHKLIVDVAIKPEQSIEFIYVPILVLEPSDSFPF
jgi:phage tail sheath protein FI